MKINVVLHKAEEGGFWTQVPTIPGCATEGETINELVWNLYEAIEGCLLINATKPKPSCEGTRRCRD